MVFVVYGNSRFSLVEWLYVSGILAFSLLLLHAVFVMSGNAAFSLLLLHVVFMSGNAAFSLDERPSLKGGSIFVVPAF